MDQPQQNEDDVVQNDSMVNNGEAGDQNSSEDTPISVSSDDSQVQDGESAYQEDSVMEGVPSSGEEIVQPTPIAVSVVSDESQDEQAVSAPMQESPAVEEQPPLSEHQPGDSESFVPPMTEVEGHDPMLQIMAEEPAESEPAPSEELRSEVVAEEPAQESTGSDSYGSGDWGSVSTEPVVEQSDTSDAPSPEQSDPIESPISDGANNEAVHMANDAELAEAPPTNPSEMINDVIAPTVASASTAGAVNAITGTPEPDASEGKPAPEAPQAGASPQKPKASNGKLKLVMIVMLVVLLFGGGAVAAYMLAPAEKQDQVNSAIDTEDVKAQSDEEDADDQVNAVKVTAPGDVVSAKALDDYKAVCGEGGLVSNSTAYKGASPHPMVVFEKGLDDKFALSLVSFKDTTWLADATKVSTGQLGVCIARKETSEKKLKSCPITDSVTKVTANVDFYSTSYTVDVYESLTGKKVVSLENASTDVACPTNVAYDKEDPKIYAGYDVTSLEASLKDYATKTL